MKLYSVVSSRTAFMLGCGLVLAGSVLASRAKADEWDKKTILTVNQPIQVRETLLQPGTYVMKLLSSQSDRHIVQIFNADQSHIINTILAVPAWRTEPTGSTQFTFWETPPGTARAMRTWYYPGDNFGQEFPYPKHLTQLASAATTTVAPAPTPTVTEAAPTETPAQPQPSVETPPPAPPETAEAAPPPPPPPPAEPAAAPQPPPPPQQLPKTSSPYPLIGLSGLILVGFSGLLRLKRSL